MSSLPLFDVVRQPSSPGAAVREPMNNQSPALASSLVTDRAIEKVAKNANQEWMEAAYKAVQSVASLLAEFSADDVAMAMPKNVTTSDKRAMGAVLRQAAKDGLIRSTPRFTTCQRINQHRCPKRIWESRMA